jgi:hypothetical protein
VGFLRRAVVVASIISVKTQFSIKLATGLGPVAAISTGTAIEAPLLGQMHQSLEVHSASLTQGTAVNQESRFTGAFKKHFKFIEGATMVVPLLKI